MPVLPALPLHPAHIAHDHQSFQNAPHTSYHHRYHKKTYLPDVLPPARHPCAYHPHTRLPHLHSGSDVPCTSAPDIAAYDARKSDISLQELHLLLQTDAPVYLRVPHADLSDSSYNILPHRKDHPARHSRPPALQYQYPVPTYEIPSQSQGSHSILPVPASKTQTLCRPFSYLQARAASFCA